MTTLFVKQLTTLDFSYLCPKRGLVGETWLVDVSLSGELDEQGMVFDFGHVKKQIKASLDVLADHRLLVPTVSTSTQIIHKTFHNTKALTIHFETHTGEIIYQSPAQAVLLVDCPEITIPALTPWLETMLMKDLPDNVHSVHLTIYHEPIESAYYHYSHGLKKHLGDCQRIAHGHRSQIQILVDDHRAPDLETAWAERWKDIYIATREDLLKTFTVDYVDYYLFGYTSDQGRFELTIPASCCYLIDTDSTVELLAEHIARSSTRLRPGQTIKVMAFEGFNKGAIAIAPG